MSLSNMAPSIRPTIRAISLFIIGRYPFIDAITLLMLLAERAKREKAVTLYIALPESLFQDSHCLPPLPVKIIYGHLFVFVACGVCMGFNMKRKAAALVNVGQLLYLSASFYTAPAMKYRHWTTVKMCSRMVGVAGFMCLYAFFTMPRPRSPSLRRIGEIFVGLAIMAHAYILVESPQDRQAFRTHMPFGDATLYVFVLIFMASALCYLPGYFVHDVSQVLVIFLSLTIVVIDCDFRYWTRRQGMDYWNQARLVAGHTCMVLGLLMYMTCTRKMVYTKED